jgi:iron complex outermembrane receptor protein
MKSSLQNRNSQYGGLTFKSQYEKKGYATFHDGIIPDGVFDTGVMATGPDGVSRNIGGMTYQEAMKEGYIEASHGSTFHYRNNEWATFTISDNWFNEMKYIALRHITFGYTVPNRFTAPVGISNLRLSIEAHNIRYLYNSLANNLNPESMSGNSNNYMYYERVLQPFIANYNFTVKFNL